MPQKQKIRRIVLFALCNLCLCFLFTPIQSMAEEAEEAEEAKETKETNLNGSDADSSPIRIAVLDIQSLTKVDPKEATLLTEQIISAFRADNRFTIIGMAEIKSMLDIETQKQILGCDQTSCIAEIGGALGVDYLIRGSWGGTENSTLFNVALLNVKSASVSSQFSRKYESNVALEKAINDIPNLKSTFFPSFEEKLGITKTSEAGNGGSSTVLPWILTGVGVVGIGVGTYFGLSAKDHFDEAESLPPKETTKTDELKDKVDRERKFSAVSFIAGGACVVGGVVWLLISNSGSEGETEPAAVMLYPSYNMFTLEVNF